MVFHHEATGNQILKVPRTAIHFEHTPTGPATEVMMMVLARQLIALGLSGHIDNGKVMTFSQTLQGPIDCRQPHAGHELLGRIEDFLRSERAILGAENLANGSSLCGVALHSAAFLASINDTLLSLHSEAVFQAHYIRAPRRL